MLDKGDNYRHITQMLSEGRIAEGNTAIENVRNQLPLSVYLECLGNVRFYERKLQDAVTLYEQAMNADKAYDAARYHYVLGVKKEQQGEYVEALNRYQASIEIEPSFPDAYVELGGLLVKVGDFEGALTCYKDALGIDRTDLRNYSNLVVVLESLSKTNPAKYEAAYQDALNDFANAKSRLLPAEKSARW